MKQTKTPSDTKKEFCLDRKFLSGIGNSLYYNEEVSGVKIQIRFKDKTKLEYSRHRLIDKIQEDVEKDETGMDEFDG
jgi:formamidopyrimidine-DNA glycosylase